MTISLSKEELLDYKNKVALYHQELITFVLSRSTIVDSFTGRLNPEEIQRLITEFRSSRSYPALFPNV